MKALITAGGRATRLRPITSTLNKHLIPLANKPMIEYALEKIRECDIKEVAINVNPGEGEIQTVIGDGSRWGLRITYLEQRGGPKGLAHIVKNAREWVGDEPFVFYLGDNIILNSVRPLLDKFKREDMDCLLSLSKVPDPQRFGVPVIQEGRIVRVLEKPERPPSEYAVTGIYVYKPVILRAVEEIQPSARGEYEISDAHTWLINRGYKVGYEEITGWWKDTGKPEDLLHGNELLLDLMEGPTIAADAIREEGVIIQGKVVVGSGTVLGQGTVVRGPVVIGKNCEIREATIGPHASVSDNVKLKGVHLEQSIVMERTSIINGPRIIRSIFGRNVRMAPVGNAEAKGRSYLLGDYAVVDW
jgi:glucose-1-phosphate thymidylyltransferase